MIEAQCIDDQQYSVCPGVNVRQHKFRHNTGRKDRAVFACTVVLENVDTGEDVEYQLVGPEESNIEKGRISVTSPLGKAIIGKKPGEEIVLNAPAGKRVYELVDIV